MVLSLPSFSLVSFLAPSPLKRKADQTETHQSRVRAWKPYESVCLCVFVPSGMQGRGEYQKCVLSCEVGVCQDNNNTTGRAITAHMHTSIRTKRKKKTSDLVSCFVKTPTEVPLRHCHDKLAALLINKTAKQECKTHRHTNSNTHKHQLT